MRLLDILIGTLVLFPLLADAVWFEIPGFSSLALSDLGIPLLAAALIVEAARRWSRESWEKSVFARAGIKILWCAAGVLVALFLLVLLWRHWAIENHGVNFGVAIWKLTHGGGAVTLVALVALAVRRWSREPWEESFFFRLGTKLAQVWLDAVRRSPGRTLW